MGAGKDRPSDPSLMRNIGAFFGHVIAAIRDDPDAPARRGDPSADAASDEAPTSEDVGSDGDGARVKARVETQEVRQGGFVLRRTTIDEVIRAPEGDADAGPKSDDAAPGDERPRA